jgi:arylsulfatase A-like enzyme
MRRRDLLRGAAASAVARAGRAAAGQPWNIVFILADDLGWADLPLYGGEDLHETPNLDRFAAGAVRFTQAYAAAPVCSPTRASIMTASTPRGSA